MLQFEGLFLASRDQDQVKKLNLNQKVKKKKKCNSKGLQSHWTYFIKGTQEFWQTKRKRQKCLCGCFEAAMRKRIKDNNQSSLCIYRIYVCVCIYIFQTSNFSSRITVELDFHSFIRCSLKSIEIHLGEKLKCSYIALVIKWQIQWCIIELLKTSKDIKHSRTVKQIVFFGKNFCFCFSLTKIQV